MFGMGGSEIVVILIIALLFLGPDKLPEAAKKLSKGIRDIKKQSRALQRQIEDDEQIGGALRDIKSALRGEEAPVRKAKAKAIKQAAQEITSNARPDEDPAIDDPATGEPALAAGEEHHVRDDGEGHHDHDHTHEVAESAAVKPSVTLPLMAGEADPDVPHATDNDDLAAMIKPAAGTVAKGN